MLHDMKDEPWERIKDSLPGKEGDSGRSAKDNIRFIAGVRKNRSTMEGFAYRILEMVKWVH
jgi:hypothetical protein